jgi:hypothetical protein
MCVLLSMRQDPPDLLLPTKVLSSFTEIRSLPSMQVFFFNNFFDLPYITGSVPGFRNVIVTAFWHEVRKFDFDNFFVIFGSSFKRMGL